VRSLNGEAIPPFVEDVNGEKIERREAMYELVSDLPAEAISQLTAVYRALMAKSESVFSASQVNGSLDAVIEVAESRLASLKEAKREEISMLRKQVVDAAEAAAVTKAPKVEEDPNAIALSDEQVQVHLPKVVKAEHVLESKVPEPVEEELPEFEEFSLADALPDLAERIPLNQSPLKPPTISTSTEPVVSMKTADPKPEPPQALRQSANPHFRPAGTLRRLRR
jgi:hypothetical protein